MSEMIERVALALAELITEPGQHPDSQMAHCMVMARAAIEAMREPTTAMINCESLPYCPGEMIEFWHAMIDAALNEKRPPSPKE